MKKIALFIKTLMLFTCLLFNHSSFASNDETMRQSILKYVNEYRVSNRLAPLSMNTILSAEAEKHSRDMAQHRVKFGHDGFMNRIARSFKQFGKERGPGAENVAFNYKTAKIVVDGWIKSPHHRVNIRGNYNLTGIGIARDKQGRIYYTQLFMRS